MLIEEELQLLETTSKELAFKGITVEDKNDNKGNNKTKKLAP